LIDINVLKVEIVSEKRLHETFHGKQYIMEKAITGDFALVKAWKADEVGNLMFRCSMNIYFLLVVSLLRCTGNKPEYESYALCDHLCGLVIRAPGYRSRGPGSISSATTFSGK
jgi:hypothetical protein